MNRHTRSIQADLHETHATGSISSGMQIDASSRDSQTSSNIFDSRFAQPTTHQLMRRQRQPGCELLVRAAGENDWQRIYQAQRPSPALSCRTHRSSPSRRPSVAPARTAARSGPRNTHRIAGPLASSPGSRRPRLRAHTTNSTNSAKCSLCTNSGSVIRTPMLRTHSLSNTLSRIQGLSGRRRRPQPPSSLNAAARLRLFTVGQWLLHNGSSTRPRAARRLLRHSVLRHNLLRAPRFAEPAVSSRLLHHPTTTHHIAEGPTSPALAQRDYCPSA